MKVTSPITPDTAKLIRLGELCERLCIGRNRINDAIKLGRAPAPMEGVGKRRKWLLADVIDILESRRQAARKSELQ